MRDFEKEKITGPVTADVFVQWKNVDICADVTCKCGEVSHLDGFWSGNWTCHGCNKAFFLPWGQTAYETVPTEFILPTKPVCDGVSNEREISAEQWRTTHPEDL